MIYAIVGPTGVGKSKVSVELAKRIDAEIISGDAYQVYKELSIATAKITEREMQGVVHHLVDCYGLNDDYNVKVFQNIARELISEIESRGKNVIICGGTGLYVKALLYDYEFHDQVFDEELRNQLTLMDNETLYSKLVELDPESAKAIHPNNKQRVIRAVEIAMSGTTKSEIVESQEHKMLYDAHVIGLTLDRDKLYEKINRRVDIMMESGLQEEIDEVVASGFDWNLQSLQTIGFKEWKAYYDGSQSVEEVVEQIKKDTRNFAKRQYTWFRNQMDVHWIDIENKDVKKIVDEILY